MQGSLLRIHEAKQFMKMVDLKSHNYQTACRMALMVLKEHHPIFLSSNFYSSAKKDDPCKQ
jgi:hypothetical protein